MAATGVGVRVRLGLGLAELVRDLRLDTEFEGDDTIIHLYHDRPGHRAIPRRETWKREKMLGSGGYGEVWLEKQVENPSWLAVKQISAKCSQSIVDLCKVELEAFAKFSRQKYAKCFVQSSGWYEGPGFISISMEYCPKGDLNHYLAWRGKLPEDEVQDIVSQVVEGLHFMHGEGFVHRDLKPGNIIIKSSLLDDHWWVKLCDFGLSKRIGEGSGASTTVKGTAGFLAPELFGFDGIDPRKVNRFAADIWSLGEMAFRILAGKATFPSVGRLRDYQLGTVAFPIEELHGVGTSELCISFIKTAMASEPKERFEAHQAMSHDWMKAQTYIMLRRALYQGLRRTRQSLELNIPLLRRLVNGALLRSHHSNLKQILDFRPDLLVQKGKPYILYVDSATHRTSSLPPVVSGKVSI
ncbi:kinase-like domain-containing protein [Hypoxylon crocopeplum]|nr:kinase-like domain-containing protein [Hypoxylon crocopeplum]